MHGWRLRKHFIQANAPALLEFVAWTWKTPLLYYNGLKDRPDEKHVYTSVAINLLDDLALPATILIICHESALRGGIPVWRMRLASSDWYCHRQSPAIRNRAETAYYQRKPINHSTMYHHHGAYTTEGMTFRRPGWWTLQLPCQGSERLGSCWELHALS